MVKNVIKQRCQWSPEKDSFVENDKGQVQSEYTLQNAIY